MSSDNIRAVKKRIKEACERVGRDPADVTLVCVTKEASVEEISEAIEAGVTHIGESRVKEALLKYNILKNITLKWHLIGHLQRNKVKDAVDIFDLIHSVDSLKLATHIQKEAIRHNKVADILIEVNVSGEESKFGVVPDVAFGLIKEISKLSNIRLLGLMTMAPMTNDPEDSRPYYKGLKEIFEEVNRKGLGVELKYLSMGMTQDFEVAIEEGANLIRVGRAIFKGGRGSC